MKIYIVIVQQKDLPDLTAVYMSTLENDPALVQARIPEHEGTTVTEYVTDSLGMYNMWLTGASGRI